MEMQAAPPARDKGVPTLFVCSAAPQSQREVAERLIQALLEARAGREPPV